MQRFHLQSHVDHLYAHKTRQLAFSATSMEAYAIWKRTLRARLWEILGIAGRVVPETVDAAFVESKQREGYKEEFYDLDVGERVKAPMYVLVPDQPPPYKPILILHGHNPSVQYILGNYPDEATRQERMSVDNNYAQALAQAGYLVCAVEQRGFGTRISDQYLDDKENACRHLSFEYLMQGRTMLGERCWDAMLALTYLSNRTDVVPGRVGCTGNSGGGTITLWMSALDDRVSVCVPGSYFCSFKHSILGVQHCECNYVPHTLEYMEMGDLAALIAPRPVRFISGEKDPIFPIAGTYEQFETVKKAYALHGVSDRCSLAVHPGEHAYNIPMSLEWFNAWL